MRRRSRERTSRLHWSPRRSAMWHSSICEKSASRNVAKAKVEFLRRPCSTQERPYPWPGDTPGLIHSAHARLDPAPLASVCCRGVSRGRLRLALLRRSAQWGCLRMAAPDRSWPQLPSSPQSPPGRLLVRRAAVLGAGTMGSRIAAHLANAGIPVAAARLFPKEAKPRNELLRSPRSTRWQNRSRPRSLSLRWPRSSRPATFDDDLPKLAQCDWVVEAVAENLDIKTALLARVTAASRRRTPC